MIFLKKVLGIFFPDSCVGCGERGTLLCFSCKKKVSPSRAPMHSFITSVFNYQDFRVKKLIWLLKYKNLRHVAEIFAPEMAQSLVEFLGEESFFIGTREILLVPVPLSKKRYAKRGYNQAELLSKNILAFLPKGNISLETKLLIKVIETKPQADIKKRNERLVNLGECFRVTDAILPAGKIIVLIDDVTTTGTTLSAARQVLARGGFKKVYALTVAH